MMTSRKGRRALSLTPLIVLATLSPQGASAQSPDETFCAVLADAARTINANGPLVIDAVTTQERAIVSCETKMILTRFVSTAAGSALPPGWQEEKQARINTLYCGDPASREIIESGWTIAEATRFSDGVEIQIKAECV